MYVLGLPACLRAALSRSVVGSHVGHTRAARGGAFGVERPETPFQTIIGTRNRDRDNRRDLRAITSDAYNGWAAPVAAGWRPRIHPPWHRHIALFTT